MISNQRADEQQTNGETIDTTVSRRKFLQFAGGIAGASAVLAACRRTPSDTVFIGRDDTGILNYLYVMQQVLCDMYKQANITQYYTLDQSEWYLLEDMREHQYAHKGWLKAVLGDKAATDIKTDLSMVTYADRTNFLTNAKTLADLAAAAYIGAVGYLNDTSYIPVLSKMATLHARHSAYCRSMLSFNEFASAEVVDTDGLNNFVTPAVGMAKVKVYIQSKMDFSTLPG